MNSFIHSIIHHYIVLRQLLRGWNCFFFLIWSAIFFKDLLQCSKLEHHRPGREATSSVSHQMPKKNSWRLSPGKTMCQMKRSSREPAKYLSLTSYDTNALHGSDMSPVCTRLACAAACSTGSPEGALTWAENAGKIQCRDTCRTLNFPLKRQQW